MLAHQIRRCINSTWRGRRVSQGHRCYNPLPTCRRFTHLAHFTLPEEHMPPDYESQSYWKKRFEFEQSFEWLGDGSDTIVPHIRSYLLQSCAEVRSSPSRPAPLLNIGAGTSLLSQRIGKLYKEVYGFKVNQQEIVHTDFAENLVERMRETEQKAAVGGTKGMRWVCADALKWGELKAALDCEEGFFDLIVDKSTSDAISCGEDVLYSAPDPSLHPVLNAYLATSANQRMTIMPVELLALHLASVVRAGGLWVALTFSSTRFAFLTAEYEDCAVPHAATYWDIEDMVTVDAPTSMQRPLHAPLVQHYVFLIRRTDD